MELARVARSQSVNSNFLDPPDARSRNASRTSNPLERLARCRSKSVVK